MAARLYKKIPEFLELEKVLDLISPYADIKNLGEISCEDGQSVPVVSLTLGKRKDVPAVGLFGGVHGLERIGTQVVLAYLYHLAQNLKLDPQLAQMFERVRIISIPLINPFGFWHTRRSNGNGVDLMRNAPVDGDGNVARLVGGHRYGPWLPWYRGVAGEPMQKELQYVTDFVKSETALSPTVLTLDCHSGFGLRDRLWFPYAKTRKPFPNLAEVFKFKQLMDEALPHHVYHIEPQSTSYCTHGDVWDYLYDNYRATRPRNVFLPLTLEMGSWLWVKKNPSQVFSMSGPFNPIVAHRLHRVLRRHLLLFDFIVRAMMNSKSWMIQDDLHEKAMRTGALKLWY